MDITALNIIQNYNC